MSERLAATLLSSAVLACAARGALDESPPPITERDFHGVVEAVVALYEPAAARAGKRLVAAPLWDLDDERAGSWEEEDGRWSVWVHGGVARHPLMTRDSLALAVCHEIGHFLGGFPKFHPFEVPEDTNWTWKPDERSPWAWSSGEGQADYFASSKCLRLLFEGDDNAAVMEGARVPGFVSERCAEGFEGREAAATCERGMMAGIALARFDAVLLGQGARFSVGPGEVRPFVRGRSYLQHPKPECRLETFLRGSLCGKSPREPFSDTDYRRGACTREGGSGDGARPLCWFDPESARDAAPRDYPPAGGDPSDPAFLTSRSSTSKIRVEPPGILGGAPKSP